MNSFEIRTYGRTELAQLYCPDLCPESAYRKLKHWIDLYPGLRAGSNSILDMNKNKKNTANAIKTTSCSN